MKVLIYILLFVSFFSCNKYAIDYYPLDKGYTSVYATYGPINSNDTITFINEAYKTIDGKEYLLQNSIIYQEYLRYDSIENIVIFWEDGVESILLPNKLKKGRSWNTPSNGWKFVIEDVNADLIIDGVKYRHLIKIREYDYEVEDNGIYYSYYGKNIGLVLRTLNGRVIMKYLGNSRGK